MSIEEEQALVRSLHLGGLTIHEIALKVGKSASWVYTRLRDEYQPKRKRDTAEVAPEFVGVAPADSVLAQELEAVSAMRVSGMTYEEIAERLHRSIYWVHSRLRGRYRPRSTRTEMLFQEQAVVPWLCSHGHTIVTQCERLSYGPFVLEADIISTLGPERWITEVKVSANGHELHTAIGQLVLHRCLTSEGTNLRCQVALPLTARPERVSDALLGALSTRESIGVVFVPWEGPGRSSDAA
jgi:transposase